MSETNQSNIMTVGFEIENVDLRVVGVIFKQGDKYCIQHHIKHDVLLIPSGKVEDSEEPLHALIREVREELGIVIAASNLRIVDIATRYYTCYGNVCEFIYVCDLDIGVLSNPEPDKHHWIKWMSLDEILDSSVRLSNMLVTTIGL